MLYRETRGYYFQTNMKHMNTMWTHCSIGTVRELALYTLYNKNLGFKIQPIFLKLFIKRGKISFNLLKPSGNFTYHQV
jgi:hypothetical protein